MLIPSKIVVSTHALSRLILILIGAYLAYRFRDIIILVFIAFLFVTAINPLVNYLEAHKLPRTLSILFTYIVVVASLAVAVAAIIPPLVAEASVLVGQVKLPPALQQDLSAYNLQDLQVLANQVTSLPKILNVIFSAFSSIVLVITFGVISFYMLLERPHLHHYCLGIFGRGVAEHRVEEFINRLETQIGGWVRGEMLLMLSVGVMTFLGLSIMQVSYALPLAILAGVFEIVPNIGPTLSAIPGVAIAYFSLSTPIAIAVAALYIVVQQLENTFMVPAIMKRVVGIHPLITILLILAGAEVGGVKGAVLAIPVYIVAKVVWVEWRRFQAVSAVD